FLVILFFFQAEDGIRVFHVTGVQTCALPISAAQLKPSRESDPRQTADAPGAPGRILVPCGNKKPASPGDAGRLVRKRCGVSRKSSCPSPPWRPSGRKASLCFALSW